VKDIANDKGTLQGTNISYLGGTGKSYEIIFQSALVGDMLVPGRVMISACLISVEVIEFC